MGHEALLTMTAFFSNRKFVSTRSEQTVRRKMGGKDDVLSSPLFELGNGGFSGSINDVDFENVEDTAGALSGGSDALNADKV